MKSKLTQPYKLTFNVLSDSFKKVDKIQTTPDEAISRPNLRVIESFKTVASSPTPITKLREKQQDLSDLSPAAKKRRLCTI